MELMVEASPRRIYANAHTYHINSISVNSDAETYLSADDLRINLWHLDITDQSFNIVDIKPANMEELTEVITAAEFHPTDCNNFVYSSSKGLIRLCDMRMAALCDRHAKCKYFLTFLVLIQLLTLSLSLSQEPSPVWTASISFCDVYVSPYLCLELLKHKYGKTYTLCGLLLNLCCFYILKNDCLISLNIIKQKYRETRGRFYLFK